MSKDSKKDKYSYSFLKRKQKFSDSEDIERSLQYQEILNDDTVESLDALIETTTQSPDQIDIGVKVPKRNYFNRIKRRLTSYEKKLEILPFWKNGLAIFTTILVIAIPIILEILAFRQYDSLSTKMPIFYNSSQKFWEVIYDRTFFLMLPVAIGIISLIIIRIEFFIVKFDKRLVNFLNLILILINLLLFISYLQILYLVV